MSSAKRDINRQNPTQGGFWRNNGTNLASDLLKMGDDLNGTTLWPYATYMEGVGAQISSAGLAQSYDAKQEYAKLLKNVLNYTDSEYNSADSLGLGCVQGSGPGTQIFNDDNVWVAMEWMNAYQLLGDNQYLTLAKRNLNFIFESWDTTVLDGGIWWCRPGREARSLCRRMPVSTPLTLGLRLRCMS